MLRLLGRWIVLALAFAAGVQFERADARTTCRAEPDWGPYLMCVAREIAEEVVT